MKESEILTLEYATQTAPQKKQSNLEYESSQKISSVLANEIRNVTISALKTERLLEKLKRDYDRQMHALPIIQIMLQEAETGTEIHLTLKVIQAEALLPWKTVK